MCVCMCVFACLRGGSRRFVFSLFLGQNRSFIFMRPFLHEYVCEFLTPANFANESRKCRILYATAL